MEGTKELLKGYDNTVLLHYDDSLNLPNTVAFDELGTHSVSGVLKVSRYVNGRLMQTYTAQENHVGVVAATRLGKTTSYVIPTVVSYAKQKIKRTMIISDPKGEIYRLTAATLKDEGYRVILLNFRDYLHSECWNILTPIFRKFKKIEGIPDEVCVVETENGARNMFRGKIYENQTELDGDISRAMDLLLGEVGNDIDNISNMFVETKNSKDPYWEDAARDLLKAFLWAMLEDSDPKKCKNPITEDTFSFSTILTVIGTFRDKGSSSSGYDDGGYFIDRSTDSRAYVLAKNILFDNAPTTRKCVMSSLMAKLSVFNQEAMRLITSCNSFEISEISDAPTAIFIDYRDELKVHYQIISLFVQDVYRFLIEQASEKPNGKLDVPVYFMLDEFGNFPAIKDFETTISACAGRNIFFILIVQSYAQLNNVYGEAVADIIKDNLNVHVFFGSNNPSTIEEFSKECGQCTRISPLSALNGNRADIDTYHIETIPLVPKSMLSHFQPGECIITEANSGYVMFSRLERYFLCEEFKNLKLSSEKDYTCSVNPFDKRYTYAISKPDKKETESSKPWDEFF